MNNLLLDTNILIYLLNGNLQLREILDDKNWFISFVTEMEMKMKPGLTKHEHELIDIILDECVIVEMNHEIKLKAIKCALDYKLKLADSIILATALNMKMSLVTADAVFKKVATKTDKVLFILP